MSSHHIVKEKQEPALFIAQMGDFDLELLGQLLEWSPTIIIQEEEYEKISSLGIKVDFIASHRGMENSQEHVEYIISKDNFTGVFDFLIEKGYPAVNIIGRSNDFYPVYAEKINIVWFNNSIKTYRIKDGFNVWKPKGSVFILADGEKFSLKNLKHFSGDKYVVINDGFVTLNFNNGPEFISEEL